MAKKILSEAQMRRFAKLANLSPMNEMYNMEEEEETPMEEAAHAEEETVEEGMYAEEEADMPAAEEPEMAEEEPEKAEMEGEEEMELTDEEAQAIIDLGKKLEAAMDTGEEAPEMDMGAEEPEMDMGMGEPAGEEEEIMEALAGIEYVPEQKEIVEEVARRVAKRLLKAKRAQAQLDEALSKK